eukprot:1426039-Amphidinium_carterae.1
MSKDSRLSESTTAHAATNFPDQKKTRDTQHGASYTHDLNNITLKVLTGGVRASITICCTAVGTGSEASVIYVCRTSSKEYH